MTRAFLTIALLGCALSAAAQSLGDVARQERNTPKQHANHVYTNDDFPSGSEPAPAPASPTDNPTTPGAKGDKPAAPEGSGKGEEKPSDENPLAKKIKDLRKSIAELEKKIADLQTEERERASAYYGDAGVQLRQPEKWNSDMQKIRDDTAAAQKELSDKRAELSDAEEQARKSGVTVQ